MKLVDFYRVLEKHAPIGISERFCSDFGGYDNSGILVNTGKDVLSAVFSLDLSVAAVEKAVSRDAGVIVTHHPAIYAKIGDIRSDEPLGYKLVKCIENGISVVSMHLNLDGAAEGVDQSLAEAVCKASGGELKDESIMYPLGENVGYGRAYRLKKSVSLSVLAENLKRILKSKNMLVFGKSDTPIEKAASFCGAGADIEAIDFAVKNGVGVIVSSDFKHHIISEALERGLCVIAPTHYASERYGFQKYYEKISRETEISCLFHEDEEFL